MKALLLFLGLSYGIAFMASAQDRVIDSICVDKDTVIIRVGINPDGKTLAVQTEFLSCEGVAHMFYADYLISDVKILAPVEDKNDGI